MKHKYILLLIACIAFKRSDGQDIFFYHGRLKESLVYNSNKQEVQHYELKKKKGQVFSVAIVNPNPLFYKYEISYEAQKEKAEDESIINMLTVLNSTLVPRAGAGLLESNYEAYKGHINQLIKDINLVKTKMNDSDIPELADDAMHYRRTGGLRLLIDQINNTIPVPLFSAAQYRIFNPNLLTDLNNLVDATALDDITKQALKVLNNTLVQQVKDLTKKFSDGSISPVFRSQFTVEDKVTKVYLVIKKIDPSNAGLRRDHHINDEKIELATIIPYYERATLELVPVASFLFASNVKEFYIENDIVKTRANNKTIVSPGTILNINVARFGEFKEMSLGIGPGYKFSSDQNTLESFFLSTLFSYKNFVRIGIGLGFSQFPSGLKDNAEIDKPLPKNIDNLTKVLKYEEKFTGFLNISFTGLSLTQKK